MTYNTLGRQGLAAAEGRLPMGWPEELEEAARYVWDAWNGLDPQTRDRAIDEAGDVGVRFLLWLVVPESVRDAAQRAVELYEALERYSRDPAQMFRDYREHLFPGSRYSELARQLLPNTQEYEGLGREVRRPVILVPGMAGTRLMRTDDPPASSGLPPDQFENLIHRLFRDEDGPLLRGVSPRVRRALAPALRRFSERRVFDPRTIWDPDTAQAMVFLMNKTGTERGALFCPDDTPGEPAEDFAVPVADSMTIENLVVAYFGLADAARILRVIAQSAGARDLNSFLQDNAFQRLLRRRRLRGWGSVVWDISQHWLLPLERHFGEVIYAFGYDWRAPLSESVDRLVRKVQRVKDHHDGRAPILVTHSFGGLLARAAAKRRPSSVGGIVQVFSPTAGAIKSYANFKKGGGGTLPAAWDHATPPQSTDLEDLLNVDSLAFFSNIGGLGLDIPFAILQGWDATSFAVTSAGVYGLYSLLPNNRPRNFGSGSPHSWLELWPNVPDAARASSRAQRNIFDLYRELDRPWGLIDGAIWHSAQETRTSGLEDVLELIGATRATAGSLLSVLQDGRDSGWFRALQPETIDAAGKRRIRERVRRGIERAEELDRDVRNYVHPNTWSLYGTGLWTDVGFRIKATDDPALRPFAMRRRVSEDGDGTLERTSACAFADDFTNQYQVQGAQHAPVMGESAYARGLMCKAVFLAMVAAHRAEQNSP